MVNPEAAILDFNKTVELEPDFVPAYYHRATAYYVSGNLEAAVADFTKTLELEPDHAMSYFNRAAVHRVANHLERYLELVPGTPSRDQFERFILEMKAEL